MPYRTWIIVVGALVSVLELWAGSTKQQVQCGLDVLAAQQFAPLRGKQVGVVCNHTAVDKHGVHLIDLLQKSQVCQVKAIFAPEHGFRGNQPDGGIINDTVDATTGARIFSLYGRVNRPTKEMLDGVDLLIYDIQDVGVRFYTYITTLTYLLESAAAVGIPVMVLDRPNPVRGDRIEGPVLEPNLRSFVGAHPIPVRYGLTVGELATLVNNEGWLAGGVKADLRVVKMKGWRRNMWYDETDLRWVAPSPNIPTVETALVYPGLCWIEGTNLSEGRGTAAPFLQFGAPWIEASRYASALNQLNLPGVRFEPVTFTPRHIPGVANRPKYEDQLCQGVRLVILDRDRFKPLESTLQILVLTKRLYPENLQFREAGLNRLYGNDQWQRLLLTKELRYEDILADWQAAIKRFEPLARRYYLY